MSNEWEIEITEDEEGNGKIEINKVETIYLVCHSPELLERAETVISALWTKEGDCKCLDDLKETIGKIRGMK